jgi:hypothetical protein
VTRTCSAWGRVRGGGSNNNNNEEKLYEKMNVDIELSSQKQDEIKLKETEEELDPKRAREMSSELQSRGHASRKRDSDEVCYKKFLSNILLQALIRRLLTADSLVRSQATPYVQSIFRNFPHIIIHGRGGFLMGEMWPDIYTISEIFMLKIFKENDTFSFPHSLSLHQL